MFVVLAAGSLLALGVVYAGVTARQLSFVIDDRKPDADRGRYLVLAAGCASCHASAEDRTAFGGGVAIRSPFGDIYSSNISPDPVHGVGAWTDQEFLNAVKRGVSPKGQHYYPAMPYARYAGLQNRDVLDIRAYLRSLPASQKSPRKTALPFPFSIRGILAGWKLLNAPRPSLKDFPIGSSSFERGQYLVEHAAHCGECHTPRTIAFGLDKSRAFEGARGFDGALAPPLTPARLKRFGFDAFDGTLKYGLTLDGAGSIEAPTMQEVAANISQLTDSDRRAIFDYLAMREDKPR